ncbi:MAG: deoxyribose-phosphate aldolase [Candidatus Zixiibacteriota bacterium]
MNRDTLVPYIEHTNLSAVATESDIRECCRQALRFEFLAVVVNPVWVSLAAQEVKGCNIRVVSVAGFPLGASRTETKVVEAVRAGIDGAAEIDMVAGVGWILSGEYGKIEDEIAQVRRTLSPEIALKVIVEASLLSRQQQIDATRAVINSGAQFVKTGTGFQGPVTVDQVRTLARAAGGKVQIKAAGGIRTLQQCRELIDAGASRLGCSKSVSIMEEFSDQPGHQLMSLDN